jgi:hypothetical protein
LEVEVKVEIGRDAYTRSARLMPALIVFLPIGLAAGAWATVVADSKSLGGLVTLATSFGLASLLAQIGRDAGRRRQDQLYARWGGKPTTVMLRHRTRVFNRHTLARYHAKLGALIPELRLPSEEQERADPLAADAVYEACIDYLLAHTRDQSKFRLVFEENVNYGFRRNLWGMKATAIAINVLALLLLGVRAISGIGGPAPVDATWIAALILNAMLLAWWLIRIRPDWVRSGADAYARQLIAACDQIESPPPSRTTIITRLK